MKTFLSCRYGGRHGTCGPRGPDPALGAPGAGGPRASNSPSSRLDSLAGELARAARRRPALPCRAATESTGPEGPLVTETLHLCRGLGGPAPHSRVRPCPCLSPGPPQSGSSTPGAWLSPPGMQPGRLVGPGRSRPCLSPVVWWVRADPLPSCRLVSSRVAGPLEVVRLVSLWSREPHPRGRVQT